MLRRTVLVTVAIALAVPANAVQADWQPIIGMDRMTWLAQCETGNNTKHRTRSYVGAFGFYRRTWNLFADTPDRRAHALTWKQQAKIAERAFWYGWKKDDGSKQWPVGPFGHACFRKLWVKDAGLRRIVCYNRKQVVRRWCR